jgi:hypothetical protein
VTGEVAAIGDPVVAAEAVAYIGGTVTANSIAGGERELDRSVGRVENAL